MKRLATTLAFAAMLTTLAMPPAAANHSLCHNEPFPNDVEIIQVLGIDVSADTGLGGAPGAYVACVGSMGLVVYVLGAPVGTGASTMIKLCNGNVPGDECSTVLGTTGASLGPRPAAGGLTCTLNACVYAWANGVQIVP